MGERQLRLAKLAEEHEEERRRLEQLKNDYNSYIGALCYLADQFDELIERYIDFDDGLKEMLKLRNHDSKRAYFRMDFNSPFDVLVSMITHEYQKQCKNKSSNRSSKEQRYQF